MSRHVHKHKKEDENKKRSNKIEVSCNCPICGRKIKLINKSFGNYLAPEHDRYGQNSRKCPFSGEEIEIEGQLFMNNISPGFKGNDNVVSKEISISRFYKGGPMEFKIQVEDSRRSTILAR